MLVFLNVIVLCSILIATNDAAFAGHSVGGGGAGVVCLDSNGRVSAIETYDYFFARKLGRDINLGSGSQSYKDLAQIALDRLAKFSPMRAKLYAEQIAVLESPAEASFLTDASLFHVPDLGQPALEPGDNCKLVQIIYQQVPRFPQDRRYLINKYYWDLLPELQKAGLALHEVIYREAMSYGQTDSSGTREFNIVFSESSVNDLSFQGFYALLRSIPFLKTDFLENSVRLGTCFTSNDTHQQRCESPGDLRTWRKLEFYSSGNLMSVPNVLVEGGMKLKDLFIKSDSSDFVADLNFSDTERPSLASITALSQFTISGFQQLPLMRGPYKAVEFYPSLAIRSVTTSNCGSIWYSENGQPQRVDLVSESFCSPLVNLKFHRYKVDFLGNGRVIFRNSDDWYVEQGNLIMKLMLSGRGGQTWITGSLDSFIDHVIFRDDGTIESAESLHILPSIKGIGQVLGSFNYPVISGKATFYKDGTLQSGVVKAANYGDVVLVTENGSKEIFDYRRQQESRHFLESGFWDGK